MSDRDVTYLSPTRLAAYAACPRAFDYESVQQIETPEETRLYPNQGNAYHKTIEAVCAETDADDDPETIFDRARAAFENAWHEHTDPDDYASRSHREYQYAENRAAIEAFFDPDSGDGIEHARRSVATEFWVDCIRDGIGLRGKADTVLRTDDGLHVIDYKRNTNGIVSLRTAESLVEHRTGEGHDAKRVRNAFQAACYIEGVTESELYEPGMTVRFSFYGLLNDTSFEGTADGYTVSARGWGREITEVYDQYYETIWELVRRAHDGITSERYDPEPFSLIHEEACPSCSYRETCGEYLSEVVRR